MAIAAQMRGTPSSCRTTGTATLRAGEPCRGGNGSTIAALRRPNMVLQQTDLIGLNGMLKISPLAAHGRRHPPRRPDARASGPSKAIFCKCEESQNSRRFLGRVGALWRAGANKLLPPRSYTCDSISV